MVEVEQVGGTHYQSSYQHWDMAEDYDIGYLEGNATAYIQRYPLKGTPREDLEKAVSYLQKMGNRDARRTVPQEALDRYFSVNKLKGTRAYLISLIIGTGMGKNKHISMAIDHIRGLLKYEKTKRGEGSLIPPPEAMELELSTKQDNDGTKQRRQKLRPRN